MATQDFLFALEFSNEGAPAELLEDVARQVLRHAGCAPDATPALMAAVEKAVSPDGEGLRRCDVRFRLQNSTLQIHVSSNGGPVWQTAIPIPD